MTAAVRQVRHRARPVWLLRPRESLGEINMTLRVASLIVLLAVTCGFAQDHDITKLPEGSVWNGTYVIKGKKDITFSSGIEIKITHREKTNFVGEWTQSANDVTFEIKGSISGNHVSFKFTKELRGKPTTGVVGGRSASGLLSKKDGKELIKGTTVTEGKPNLSGEWDAELKTN